MSAGRVLLEGTASRTEEYTSILADFNVADEAVEKLKSLVRGYRNSTLAQVERAEKAEQQISDLKSTLRLYVVFRGGDEDGGEHDECVLCEQRWPAEGDAMHDMDCVLR